MAITAVLDLYPQVVDYTIDPDSGGGTGVPTSFSIQGTLPIRINGGASADLSTSPDIISVNTFGAAAAGIVPLSGGGTTNFLRADGTWANPVGSGGYSTVYEDGVALTQRGAINFISSDITATDNAGTSRTDVTLTRFSSIVGGTVPASGGSASAFLCADGTWKTTVGAAGQVSLQASTPGTADSGNFHVSGTGLVDAVIGVGTNAPFSQSKIHTVESSGSRPYAFIGQNNGNIGGANLVLRRSRGTTAVPTATQGADGLGSFYASGYSTAGGYYDFPSGFSVFADGNANASDQPTYLDLRAGFAGTYMTERVSQNGILIKPGSSTSTSDRATSTFQVYGSSAVKTTVVSTITYTVLATDNVLLCDTSAVASVTASLPTAIGIGGRVYKFVKTDSSAKAVIVQTSLAQSISGISSWYLQQQGESIVVVSDGANWQILALNVQRDRVSSSSDTVYASSTAETDIAISDISFPNIRVGAISRFVASGKLSTTGTPTLRFRLKNANGETVADSNTVTMPNGVTNVAWTVEYETAERDGSTPRVLVARLQVAQTAGFGAVVNTYNMFDVALSGLSAYSVAKKLTAAWSAASSSNTLTRTSFVTSITLGTETF